MIQIVIVEGVSMVHSYTSFLTLGAAVGGLRIGDMITTLVFFLVLLFLLKKYAWGPLMDMMEEREQFVANEIDTAEKSRKEAEIASKEAAAQLMQTKEEAQTMIQEARDAGVKQEADIIEAAQLEAERLIVSAQQDIQNEKEKAVKALQDQVASLSVLIASKVIEKELDTADQEDLINEYIKEVGEEQ